MEKSGNEGLTTRLLHADRRGGVEHGATHKPLHPSSAFGYDTARELVSVFKGERLSLIHI